MEFPYRDGWALLDALRDVPCRFVVLTTDAQEAQAHGTQAGVDVVVEPFDLDALLAAASGHATTHADGWA